MFRGVSSTLKTEDLMCQPVEITDPKVERNLLVKKMHENGIPVAVWPETEELWGVVFVENLQEPGLRPLEVSAVAGLSLSIDSPVEEVIKAFQTHLGKALVVVDDHKKPVGVIDSAHLSAIVWDQMRRLECFMSSLMDTVNEAVTIIDDQNVVVGWNRRAEELYRIPGKTIVGQEINRFFSSLVVTHVISKDIVKKKGVRNNYHQPVPGTHVLINASPIIYRDQAVGSVCSERDITETVRLHNELSKASSEVRQLKNEITKIHKPDNAFQKICGHSKKLQETVALAQRVASTNVSVLIRGESGTGKELFAEAIHNESPRRGKPFVIINCAAIPAPLFESELFGYQSGAFTGADRKGRQGKFEIAHQGTIFLDEIGELALDLQVKLLRVLQNKCFYRVGGSDPVDVDVRVIAATHRDLEQMIADGTFREDLYYRINVVSVEIPPLRQRKEDIPELIYLFIREFCHQQNRDMVQLAPEVMTTLLNYPWPGNIRELRNVVERMVILAEDNMILEDHLPSTIRYRKFTAPDLTDATLTDITDRTEREIILQALEGAGGDKSKAAKKLGIPRSTLYYKMKKFDIR